MDVRGILRAKGNEVATIAPGDTVAAAVDLLRSAGIGAVVVSRDGEAVDGILSERDIVRGLADRGTSLLADEVRQICTQQVRTAGLDDTTDQLMAAMTSGRFRHLPVLDDGKLAGIVSIGDIVKHRVSELEGLTEDLKSYVSGTW
ncbi:MAG: CBS domain-containing protein [Actinomycetota bacterium]